MSFEFAGIDAMSRQEIRAARNILRLAVHHHDLWNDHAYYSHQLSLSPKVTSVILTSDVSVKGLTGLLNHSEEHLVEIVCKSHLYGNAADMERFCKALERQSKVEKLYWDVSRLRMEDGSVERHGPVEKIILSASKLPKLKIFWAGCCDDPSQDLSASLFALLKNCALSDLRMTTLNKREATVVSDYLKSPGCTLEFLELKLDGHDAVSTVVESFHLNQSLRKISLVVPMATLANAIVKTATALEKNKWVRELSIGAEYIHGDRSLPSADYVRAKISLEQLMAVNYSITRVELYCYYGQSWLESNVVDLYIRFNTLGRKTILENTDTMTRSDWIDALAKDTNDANWLFFVLLANPELYESTEPASMATASAKHKLTLPKECNSRPTTSTSTNFELHL